MNKGNRFLTTYYKNQFGEYIDCENDMCHHGGIDVGHIIREAYREEKTHISKSTRCSGHEKMGRSSTRNCGNFWTITAEIKYKENNIEE